jgi:hypothetical protein
MEKIIWPGRVHELAGIGPRHFHSTRSTYAPYSLSIQGTGGVSNYYAVVGPRYITRKLGRYTAASRFDIENTPN